VTEKPDFVERNLKGTDLYPLMRHSANIWKLERKLGRFDRSDRSSPNLIGWAHAVHNGEHLTGLKASPNPTWKEALRMVVQANKEGLQIWEARKKRARAVSDSPRGGA